MELYKDILIKVLQNEEVTVTFKDFNEKYGNVVESRCYQALSKIKEIIEDDYLDDEECFMRIEEIVRVFEEIGSNGGNRHDF